MKEWDVYIDGKHVGTVHAKDEDEARLAAIYKFDVCIPDIDDPEDDCAHDELSVKERG